MNKYLLLTAALIFLFASCKDENKNNSQNNPDSLKNNESSGFTAKIDNSDWTAENYFYEKDANLFVLTAISANGERLFLTIDSDKPADYILDDRSFFVTEDETFYLKKGTLKIENNENNTLTGNFDFNAKSFSDSLKSKNISGEFLKIAIISNKKDSKKFNTTKTMEINPSNGNVEYLDVNYEISVETSVVIFKDIDDAMKSFSVKISNTSETSTGGVYTTDDLKIEKVFIDLLKKQATIFYKSGNSKIFY